jgi:hypothetical protein
MSRLIIRAEIVEAPRMPVRDTLMDVERAVRVALENEGLDIRSIDVRLEDEQA